MPAREKPILFSAPMIRAILDIRKWQTRQILKLSRAVGEPDVPPGHVLDLIYPGSVQHYGYVTPAGQAPSWRVQRLCDASCEHTDDAGPYDGRHSTAWGPMPYAPGDVLWCKETWNRFDPDEDCPAPIPPERWGKRAPFSGCEGDREIRWTAVYRADGEIEHPTLGAARWRPSIFMPRWASRLTIAVTGVRIQRLKAISGEDAAAEGVSVPRCECEVCRRSSAMCPADASAHVMEFAQLWDSINGKPRPMLDDDGDPVLDDDGRPRMGASRSWASNPWVWAVSFRRIT